LLDVASIKPGTFFGMHLAKSEHKGLKQKKVAAGTLGG
jgi:hypothetical protein